MLKIIKFLNLFIVILFLFLIIACSKTISEEQKAAEREVSAFMNSMDEALAYQDWAELSRLVEEHFTEDILIRVEDTNRRDQGIRLIPLQQYRFMLQHAPQVILDYKRRYKERNIEVAPDGKSARAVYRHVETTTMRREAAIMMAPYLFEGKDMASIEDQVTIENEEQITMLFEYREGKLFVTQIDSKLIEAKLIRIKTT